MADPLARTFDVLATTANNHAVETLLSALDVPNDRVRYMAAAALLRRGSTRGQIEVIRRLESFGTAERDLIEKHVSRITTALRQCLIHGDRELRRNGLEIVYAAEAYDLFPTLVDMLQEKEQDELHDLAAGTIEELVRRVHDHCRFGTKGKATRRYLRNAPQVKHGMVARLERACADFSKLSHPREVVEGILALGDAESLAIKKVLLRGDPACRQLAADLLASSKHPGVMQLILDFLSKGYPPPRVFEAIQQRKDPEFLDHLLRWFPRRLSPIQQKNIRRIESLAWIEEGSGCLEKISTSLHETLVRFVTSTGLSGAMKQQVQEWIIRHGSMEGRLAAADVLTSLDEEAAQTVVLDSLESQDANLQAWATTQLRSQAVPEALQLLIDRLDSPMTAVREAARTELGSFNLDLLLSLFDHLDPQVCLRAGQLIQKIDPACIARLSEKLADPVRSKRIRVARGARALGMHLQVVPALLAMLEDSDPLVRRTALEVLAVIEAPETLEALERLLNDPSPRVRDEARKAIEQRQTSAGHTDKGQTPCSPAG